jgi:hypothetical protein
VGPLPLAARGFWGASASVIHIPAPRAACCGTRGRSFGSRRRTAGPRSPRRTRTRAGTQARGTKHEPRSSTADGPVDYASFGGRTCSAPADAGSFDHGSRARARGPPGSFDHGGRGPTRSPRRARPCTRTRARSTWHLGPIEHGGRVEPCTAPPAHARDSGPLGRPWTAAKAGLVLARLSRSASITAFALGI